MEGLGYRMTGGHASAPIVGDVLGAGDLGPSVYTVTPEGIKAANEMLKSIIGADHELFGHSIITDYFWAGIEHDVRKGREHAVFNALGHYVDLTGAYMVFATLVAQSGNEVPSGR